jgi:CHAT domain-containing protein/tetratricopeptide (TPR) repeat protein
VVRFVPAVLGALTLWCGQPPPSNRVAKRDSSPASAAELDSLATIADSLYRTGNYVQAETAWSAALRLSQGEDPATEARVLTSLGLTEWRLGEYEEAWTRTEQARALLEANGPRMMLPRTYNAQGLIAWDQGRLSEAAELWRRTMRVAREVGDQEYVDKPAMNLGLWYAGIGDLANAHEAFAASLTAGRKLGLRPLELRSLVNLAMVANQMGEPRLALDWLDSAAAAGVGDDFLAEDNYRSQLAVAAWAMGDPGLALTGLDSAVRAARQAGLRESEAANLTLMADIYWEAGDLPRALGLHSQAEAIHRELDLPAEQGQNLYSAARIRATTGDTTQARGLASSALTLHQRAEDLPHQLDDRLLLAELGDADQLPQARDLARKLSTRGARTKLGLTEGHIAANASRPREVLRAIAAIAPDLASGLSAEVSEAEALRARAYASLGQWDSATTSGRRAIEALERIRSGYGSDLLRASFTSSRAGIYGDLVIALLALGRTDEAFEVTDAAHGGRPQARGPPGQLSSASSDEELLRQIGSLEGEIQSREDEGLESSELRERLGQAEREYEIALLNTASGRSKPTRPGADARQIRGTMAPDEVMLDYLVTPERLFVFTLTRQQIQVRVVPVRAADIESSVRLARHLLGDPSTRPEDADAVLGTLSRWLLGPVTTGADAVRRLVLVPYGTLAYLPFGALKTTDGKYLVERYSLVYLPAASFVAASINTTPVEGNTAVTALAPLPRDLPATVLEVSAVERAHPGTHVLVGRRADEAALRQALGSAAVVHVATHGTLNGVNPLFSRIELVPGRSPSPDNDGRLEVHEVLRLEIHSPLVFLSGCETGLGPGASRRYTPGEDYATLAAAFLTAGAREVVATLWAIPDTGAAVFAARFYAELNRTGVADALAAAQRALLADSHFRHPFYWAGYRVAGSESTGRHLAL